MPTFNGNIYNVSDYLTSTDFAVIADTTNKKFNEASWKKFASWGQLQRSRKFDVVFSSMNIAPMAAVIDANSKKPLREAKGLEAYGGNIPKIGHANLITENDILNANQMGAIDSPLTKEAMLDLVSLRLSDLIAGMQRRLTFFLYQAMSTGSIVVDNNGDGIPLTVAFPVPASNKLKVKEVWSVNTANGIQDMMDLASYCEVNNIPFDYYIMTKKKLNQLLLLPSTIELAKLLSTNGNNDKLPLTTDQIKSVIMAYLNKPIVVIEDNQFVIDVDGTSISVEGFDNDMVSIGTVKQNYEMRCAVSAQSLINTPTAIRTSIEDGRITILETFIDEEIQNKLTLEAWAMPVILNPKNLVIMDTATAA